MVMVDKQSFYVKERPNNRIQSDRLWRGYAVFSGQAVVMVFERDRARTGGG